MEFELTAGTRGAWDYTDSATDERLPPRGRRVSLAGRGEMFVRSVPGPVDARPVVLLHGWIASGGLNWFRTRLESQSRRLVPGRQ